MRQRFPCPIWNLAADAKPPEAHQSAEAFSTSDDGPTPNGCLVGDVSKNAMAVFAGNWCNQLMWDSSKNACRLERNCPMRRHWHWFGNLRAHHSKKELLQREEVYGSWMAGLLFYIEANHLRLICESCALGWAVMQFHDSSWMLLVCVSVSLAIAAAWASPPCGLQEALWLPAECLWGEWCALKTTCGQIYLKILPNNYVIHIVLDVPKAA